MGEGGGVDTDSLLVRSPSGGGDLSGGSPNRERGR